MLFRTIKTLMSVFAFIFVGLIICGIAILVYIGISTGGGEAVVPFGLIVYFIVVFSGAFFFGLVSAIMDWQEML